MRKHRGKEEETRLSISYNMHGLYSERIQKFQAPTFNCCSFWIRTRLFHGVPQRFLSLLIQLERERGLLYYCKHFKTSLLRQDQQKEDHGPLRNIASDEIYRYAKSCMYTWRSCLDLGFMN